MEEEGMGFAVQKGLEEGIDFEPEKGLEDVMDFIPEKGFYQPSNDETWESYQALFCIVEQQLCQLGKPPRAVICGAADEILGIMRIPYLSQIQKHYEVEKLIGTMSIDVFNQLVLSTNEIKDYNRAKHEEIKDEYFYQPRSSATWKAYNMLLATVERECGEQPHLVLCLVANELIAVLRNEEKKLKTGAIREILNLGFVTDKLILDLFVIVEHITDYNPEEFIGPTDLISEDTLLMMMGEERKELKKKRVFEVVCHSILWSDDEEEDSIFEGEDVEEYHHLQLVNDVREKLVLDEEQCHDHLQLTNAVKEKLVLDEEECDHLQLANDVKEKLVLNEDKKEEEEEDDDDDDDVEWVDGDVTVSVKEDDDDVEWVDGDVTVNVKEEDEYDWVIV